VNGYYYYEWGKAWRGVAWRTNRVDYCGTRIGGQSDRNLRLARGASILPNGSVVPVSFFVVFSLLRSITPFVLADAMHSRMHRCGTHGLAFPSRSHE